MTLFSVIELLKNRKIIFKLAKDSYLNLKQNKDNFKLNSQQKKISKNKNSRFEDKND